MFKVWAKIIKENHLLQDIVVENPAQDTRTHKVFQCLEQVCYAFDLSNPIWLDANVTEFRRLRKTRFTKDCFIEEIDFDYLDAELLLQDVAFFPLGHPTAEPGRVKVKSSSRSGIQTILESLIQNAEGED